MDGALSREPHGRRPHGRHLPLYRRSCKLHHATASDGPITRIIKNGDWLDYAAAMDTYTIYHNPRCSKSRAALALLQQHHIEVVVIEYLKTPPGTAELRAIIAKLGIRPEQLVRKGEDIYKSHYAGRQLSDAEWIEALVRHPILIERPIVVHGARAVLGRPPESVAQLLP